MNGTVFIGISGFGGAGKSTLSEFFMQQHGFRRVSFADPIRKMLMALGIEEAVLRDPVMKNEPHPALAGRTPVHAMETLGTDWGRNLMHPEFWIMQLARQARNQPFLICDDVRYQNEADLISQHFGGSTYRLIVPGKEPVRNTDFAVQKLTNVIDIVNEHGVTRPKDIYRFVYARAFGQTQETDFAKWIADQKSLRSI